MYLDDRGDLPLRVSFAGAVRKIQWQVDVTQLDYNHYLPVFFEGLCDVEEPYCFLALQGTLDLVERGGDRSLCCIPQLIIPMKRNLLTKIPCVLSGQMKVLQKLVLNCPYAAEALVPYYRQFLLTFNLFLTQQANGGIDLDNGSSNSSKIVEMITETLYLLEKYGGEDAFVNIKYMIPTYESCLQ